MNPLSAAIAQGLRPLNPNERVSNPDGSFSTERTVTVQMPDGTMAVVPSLWMAPTGQPVDTRSMGDDWISDLARAYEQSNGTAFPRFQNALTADGWAARRSEGGGTGQGQLARRDRQR